jgi:hypothetical protein
MKKLDHPVLQPKKFMVIITYRLLKVFNHFQTHINFNRQINLLSALTDGQSIARENIEFE